MAIDFKQWTDAQLEAGLAFRSDPSWPALNAEYQRRQAEGLDDGSKARVAAFVRTAKTARRRRG